MSPDPEIEVWVLGDPDPEDGPFWAAVFGEDLDALEDALDRPMGFLQQSDDPHRVGERHPQAERLVNELFQSGRIRCLGQNPLYLVRQSWVPPKSGSIRSAWIC